MNTVNLIPPRHAAARLNRRRRTLWTVACTLIGIASATTIAVSMANMPPTADGEAQLARLVTGHQELNTQAAALMGALEAKTGEVALLERVSRQPDWSELLDDLAGWSADRILLEQVAIRLDAEGGGFQMSVIGLSRSQELVGDLVKSMRESKRFARVTLGGTQRVDLSEPATFRFDIRCTIAGLGTQAEALR